jgi:glycosyltransferase involved in cell wall biosynthesis
VPREELYELFRYARAFVYPSLFEGFGMPVAEALAAGLPVACSDIEPLRTVAGGSAELFNPGSDESLLAAIERVMHDDPRRAQLTAAGRARASAFRWARCARETLASLARAASGV